MRYCHCVGHLTNPGGRCCRDLAQGKTVTVNNTFVPAPLTEERVRELVREMLKEQA